MNVNLVGASSLVTGQFTPGTTAYTAKDAVGGVVTLEAAARESKTTLLNSVVLVADGAHSAALDILIFGVDPTTLSATVTDNAAFAWGSSAPQLQGRVQIEAADWDTDVGSSAKQVCVKEGLGILCEAASNSFDLYAVVIDRGATTWTSGQVIEFKFGFLQD